MAGRRKDLPTALQELAGKGTTVNLRINLVGGTAGPRGSREEAMSPQRKRALRSLQAKDREVTEWLQGDPARAAAFLADPAGTLRKSGIDIDPKALGVLAAQGRGPKLPPGVRLGKVDVRAGGREPR